MTDQQPHTPTTQYVRNSYIDHRYSLAAEQGEFPPGIVERMNEFDRWYAAEFGRIIAAAEQRGAIKALRGAADSVDLIDHMYANLPLNRPIAIREASKYLHVRADLLEGDDGQS